MKPDSYKNTIEFTPEVKVSQIFINPGMTPNQLEEFTANSNAVVLIVYATGASPESLNEVIKNRTDEGIPVFLVSNNPGDNHGILKITYGTQEKSKNSGAFALEKVNVNNLEVINAVIEQKYKEGKRGAELGRAVQEEFLYKDNESRPIPSWEDPIQIAEQERIYRQTLKRQGSKPEEIEKIIKEWRG